MPLIRFLLSYFTYGHGSLLGLLHESHRLIEIFTPRIKCIKLTVCDTIHNLYSFTYFERGDRPYLWILCHTLHNRPLLTHPWQALEKYFPTMGSSQNFRLALKWLFCSFHSRKVHLLWRIYFSNHIPCSVLPYFNIESSYFNRVRV